MDIFKSWLATKFIAHRGYHNERFAENSLSAFEHAIEHDYAIELDVCITDDGAPVVFHDNSLSRMTRHDGYITNSKLEDLRNMKLLKTEDTIPTFEEALALIGGRVPILIDIKSDSKIGLLEKKVLEILRDYDGEFAIQSFNPYTLEYFKSNAPHILRGQLSSFFKGDKDLSFSKRYALKRMMFNKISMPNFISYEFSALPNRYVDKYAHLPVLAWTVRTNDQYEHVKKHCTNIIFEGFTPTKDEIHTDED